MSISVPRSPSVRTKSYHHGDLRNALLASARELAAEQNIDAFHLREVARRAGVSHTAAYNHFADKAALVEALVIEAFTHLTDDLRVALEAAEDPLDRLERIGVAYVGFAYRHPAEFRFMWRPEHCAPRLGVPEGIALRNAGSAAYDVLVDAVETALRSGVIAGDLDTLVLAAWCGVHGLAALLVDGPRRNDTQTLIHVETLARGVTGTLIAGMLVRSAPAPN